MIFDSKMGREVAVTFLRGLTPEEISEDLRVELHKVWEYLEAKELEAKKFCEDVGIAEQVPHFRSGIRGKQERLGTFIAMSVIWEMHKDQFLSSKEIARQLGMGLRAVQRRLALLDRDGHYHGGLTTHVRPRNSLERWVLRLLGQCKHVQEYYGCRQIGPDFLAFHDLFGWILIECKKSSAGIPIALIELLLGTRHLRERTEQGPDKRVIFYEDISKSIDPRVASEYFAHTIHDELDIEIYRITRDFCPFRTCPDWEGCVPISGSDNNE